MAIPHLLVISRTLAAATIVILDDKTIFLVSFLSLCDFMAAELMPEFVLEEVSNLTPGAT